MEIEVTSIIFSLFRIWIEPSTESSRALFQASKILSISSWLIEAIFLWKMDEYLVLKRDSWTRKNVKCRWNGYVRVFDFTAATRGIFNQPHRSTEWEDLGQRLLSRQSISATISYSSFNFESISASFYRETEIPSQQCFSTISTCILFFFFISITRPFLHNQNIIILVKFHKLEFIKKISFNNDNKTWDRRSMVILSLEWSILISWKILNFKDKI